MFFLWYIFHLLIIINYSISDQLCIDRCQFEYDLHSNFSLPSECNITRRDNCFVLTTFDYSKQIVKVYFSLEYDPLDITNIYQTDTTISTIINLADPPFIQHSIEHFCSTGDHCDLNYVENIAIPKYSSKACDDLRSEFIQYLNPNPPSFERDCYLNENTTLKCNQPCEFMYNNPNEISRSCDGELNMMFKTTVGLSTPINKPENYFRKWDYACTTSLCNGKPMQEHIEKLIYSDNEKCLIIFNQTNETTTHIPSKSLSIFKKSYSSIIFIISFFSLTFIFIQLNTY